MRIKVCLRLGLILMAFVVAFSAMGVNSPSVAHLKSSKVKLAAVNSLAALGNAGPLEIPTANCGGSVYVCNSAGAK